MSSEESYNNERLDHLGIVAGVCQEIGLATWLDALDPTHRQQVSVGTATVAMILNGLGESLRQLYLVPQYFANKPVEHCEETATYHRAEFDYGVVPAGLPLSGISATDAPGGDRANHP